MSSAVSAVTRISALAAVPGFGCPVPGRRGAGRAAIERAAPAHLRTVRSLVFDAVTPTETEVMATVVDKVLERLEGIRVEHPR